MFLNCLFCTKPCGGVLFFKNYLTELHYEMQSFQPHLLLIHVAISCALQKGGHTRMYLASAPPCVFGGQGIAYNVGGVYLRFLANPQFAMKHGFFVFKARDGKIF